MADLTFVPAEMFITYRREGDSGRLGFMSPEGTDDGAKKRKQTQTRWAYSNLRIVSDTDYRVPRYENVDGRRVTTGELPLDEDLYPETLKNELQAGFRIADNVRRSGWNGGNTVWRIEDPRGFELEITSGNFAQIVDCCTLTNGVIEQRCVWGRMGAANVLLPENSEPYMSARARTDRLSSTVRMNEVGIGDTVDVLNQSIDGPARYLGKYWLHLVGVNSTTRQLEVHDSIHRHVFEVDSERISINVPKLSRIISKADATTETDPNVIAKTLGRSPIADAGSVFATVKKKTVANPLRICLGEEIAVSSISECPVDCGLIVEYDERMWYVAHGRWNRGGYSTVLVKLEAEPDSGDLHFVTVDSDVLTSIGAAPKTPLRDRSYRGLLHNIAYEPADDVPLTRAWALNIDIDGEKHELRSLRYYIR